MSGDTLMVDISTKTQKNLDKLIEAVLLQAEMLDLKTNFESLLKELCLSQRLTSVGGLLLVL